MRLEAFVRSHQPRIAHYIGGDDRGNTGLRRILEL
jgi:hypothetical protein